MLEPRLPRPLPLTPAEVALQEFQERRRTVTLGYRWNHETTIVLNLNPGFDITVKVPFDVPKGTVSDAIELHDSAFSGAAVTLG